MKIFFLVILFTISLSAKSQTGIYRTYEDFTSGKLEVMDTIVNYSVGSLSQAKIYFLDNNGKEKVVKSTAMWGFVFKGYLFRSVDKDFGMLTDSGNVYFWETGLPNLVILMDGRSRVGGHTYAEFDMYFSKDIGGKLYTSAKKLGDTDPAFEPLIECTKKINKKPEMRYGYKDYTRIFRETRSCVAEFNSR